MEIETAIWSESPNGRKPTAEQRIGLNAMDEPLPKRQKNKIKNLWSLQSEMLAGNLGKWVIREYNKEIVIEFTKCVSSSWRS